MKRVELWRGVEPSLIVADNTGVTYSNQVGGYACNYPQAEGFLVPLGLPEAEARMAAHFTGPAHNGWCSNGITDEDANLLDELFSSRRIRVDRTRLGECQEAWVHVLMDEPGEIGLEEGVLIGASAILTWNNSD